MDLDDEAPRVKRFKHQSYNQSLKEVHLTSALKQSQFDHEITDNESHFHEALLHWRQLNLAPQFIRFAKDVDLLSASMPLLLHNWRPVVDLWLTALEASDEEGLKALLDLLQKLAHDLRTTLSPVYSNLLDHLLKFLPRVIPASVLTILLETLSSLFKYLLVPSIDEQLLEQSWASLRKVLPKCLPEVQRAVAEVWGSVLRRLKTSARERAALLMVEDLTGVEDACAYMFGFACKSVSQTLHTSTASILSPILTHYLACSTPDIHFTLFRRVLTALIHHVKNADGFSILGDLLVDKFVTLTAPCIEKGDNETLRRILEIISVPCSVRNGSRLSQKQLSTVISDFHLFPMTEELEPSLLKLATATLTAGDMVLWMGPGRKVIELSWNHTQFVIKLCGALAELNWGGWKMVVLPTLLRTTPQLLEKEPKAMLGLLAMLHKERKLGDVDLVWKQRLQTWVTERLTEWKRSQESVLELAGILTLFSYVPSVAPLLVQIVETMLETPDPKVEYAETFANSGWVLGSCLQTLSSQDVSTWNCKVDFASWVQRGVAKFGWSESVLEGLVELSSASSSAVASLSSENLYLSLQESLLSHSRSLRLNTLRLLASSLFVSSPGFQDVVKRCLQGEEVSLDTQGVRERILRIGRVGQVVQDSDEVAADLCARWIIAQLKVNLRPLWSPAAGALASLSQRFGDLIWRLVFAEVRNLYGGNLPHSAPPWIKDRESGQELDDPLEEERTWRDPSAHKLRSAVRKRINNEHAKGDVIASQGSQQQLDLQTYEFQLLNSLSECSSLAEKHNRELVPFFLSLTGPAATAKLPRQKLSAWLTLFSKFSNPKALYSTDTLRTLYITLLSHPDRSLQLLALSCISTYKSPRLSPHEERIRVLLDETRWRDELMTFDLEQIEPQDRSAVVDVVIRLLYGLMLEKRGRSRGADRRAAVLGTLAGCSDEELGLLVELMLGPGNTSSTDGSVGFLEDASQKQQIGFLTLLGDVLKNLGSRLVPHWPALLSTTVRLIGQAQARIASSHAAENMPDHDIPVDELEEADDNDILSTKVIRSIRQLGLRRFADFFRSPVQFDFTPFLQTAFTTFISPRLASLDVENTQAPSALLELFYTWTFQGDHVKFLVDYDARVLPKIYDCLIATNVKPAVISRIFDIIDRLLVLSTVDEQTSETVIKPHVTLLLANLSTLVERTKDVATASTLLGQRQISILSEIAQYLTDATQASTLLSLFSPLLRKPAKLVPEKVKSDLLKIISNLLTLIPSLSDKQSPEYVKTYELLSRLFQSLRSRQARLRLVLAFQRLALIDVSLQSLVALLDSLNSYSTKRIDEPDFDRRFTAFATLNESAYSSLSSQEWLPILYNMLHAIQDPDELAIRNNASFALRHFIDVVAGPGSSDYEAIFIRILFPGLKNGLRSKNELVRSEVLGVIAYAVAKCDRIPALQEMTSLLAGGDDEASFFTNILHVQVHRRIRALGRLADQCDEGHLRGSTLADIFVPLVGNYIHSAGSIDHLLVDKAITTTGRMAKHLAWGAYYALVQKYLALSRDKHESERVFVRTLVALLDNFHFPMDDTVPEVEQPAEDEDGNADDTRGQEVDAVQISTVSQDAPQAADVKHMSRIADAVNLRLLPSLLSHLEKYDATTEDSTRIPIAMGIVRVAKHLPASTREPQIARLLTVLSQVLRSRSQETRDLTCKTLCGIAVSLGPDYLPLMLRELRGALLRGPQLHVLAYAVHALLVHVTSGDHAASFHTLDECVSDVAYVSAEVVFGESGKDVQAEGFKTKMREVRTSAAKGLDSFAIMAKCITPPRISGLLFPLKAIMQQTESLKVMQLVEEVLKRIASGLNANKHLVSAELMVLCHTLINQNARFLQQAPTRRKGAEKVDAIVQMKRQVATHTDHYANNSFRFVSFGLDLFHTALRRNKFDFREARIIARLESMVVVVGNTLYSTSTPVLLLGLKAAAGISKCPLKTLDKSLPVFVRQILDIIKQVGNTESEVVQVAFKSLATILREGPTVQVKEKDLVYILELVSPDLEDPARQTAVFAILRAIVARKFVVPEIYDLMDKVAEIMVTNQSPQVQELCRGVLLQFLLDYPQGKGRLRNQMAFLAKNLSYVHESGRKSVMELLGAVITKFEDKLVHEYADLLFVALVMDLANDDSTDCRRIAGNLIRALVARLEDEHRRVIMSHLHSWASQSQPQLVWVSSQVYGLVVDELQLAAQPYTASILADATATLEHSARQLSSIEESEDAIEVDMEWQVPYYALTVLEKLLRTFPDLTTQSDAIAWRLVVAHMLFPHAWVRMASCKLLGLLFAAVPPIAPRSELPEESPLSLIGMREVAKKLCLQLKSEHLEEKMALQITKNLFYIGKCFCTMPISLKGVAETANPEVTEVDDSGVGAGVDEPQGGEDGDDGGTDGMDDPLPWLFSKLSYQVRSAHIARRNRTVTSPNWVQQPSAVLRWFAAMAAHMDAERLAQFLIHVLAPLYRITEDDTIREPQMDELKGLAVELQDLVQERVGTTRFASTYNQVRQGVVGVRHERRAARVLQTTINPEAAAKRKQQRNSVKKESRKRKSQAFADRKGSVKRRREEELA